MIFFSFLPLFIISVFPRSPSCPVHRKVGVFQINVVVGTVRHKSSGVEIKPAMVKFTLNPDKWVLENNYNEKSARLKNSVEGISFSVMFLFKTAGSPLPKPVKVPILALAVQAPAEGSSEPSRLQALVDMRRPLALTDGTPVTPTKRIVLPEPTAQPASTRPQALQPVDQQARFPPNASLQLQTGADGRVRLVPSGQKRPAGSVESSVPAPASSRRRLCRKSSKEEARAYKDGSAVLVAGEESEEEQLPVVAQTPSPVPAEVAAEDESPQDALGELAEPVQDSSNSWTSSAAKDDAGTENDVE